LIDRAFSRHWIPHDAIRYWKKSQPADLKTYLHEIREARNSVHANLFQKGVVSRSVVESITFVVDAMYSFLEIKNARNFMKHLHAAGEISDSEYRTWKTKQARVKE